MNLFQKQQNTSGYDSIPNDNTATAVDDDTTVLLGTSILPTTKRTTTMDRRSLTWMVVIGVGMMMVAAGGTVWLRDGTSLYTTAAVEGLVVVSTHDDFECLPADGTFSGKSVTTTFGETDHFETCYQWGNDKKYCWTKSIYIGVFLTTGWFQCKPEPQDSDWHPVDPKYVNPVTNPYSCGSPCQDVVPPDDGLCLPADGTFSGKSVTSAFGESHYFETCYQYGDEKKYCWSKSHFVKETP